MDEQGMKYILSLLIKIHYNSNAQRKLQKMSQGNRINV